MLHDRWQHPCALAGFSRPVRIRPSELFARRGGSNNALKANRARTPLLRKNQLRRKKIYETPRVPEPLRLSSLLDKAKMILADHYNTSLMASEPIAKYGVSGNK